MRWRALFLSSNYHATIALIISLTISLPVFICLFFHLPADYTPSLQYYALIGSSALIFFVVSARHLPTKQNTAFSSLNFNVITFMFSIWIGYTIADALLKGVSVFDKDLVKLGVLLVLFFLIRETLISKSERKAKQIFTFILLASGLIAAFTGLLQLCGVTTSSNQYFMVTGGFKNPAPFALYLAAIFSFSIAIFAFTKGPENSLIRVLALITCCIILFIVPFTRIRSSWLSILIASIIVVHYKYNLVKLIPFSHYTPLRKISISITFTLFIATFIFGLYKFKPLSVAGRALVWKVSISKLQEHPLVGVGYSNFKKKYNLWQSDYFRQDSGRLEEKSLFVQEPDSYLAGNVRTAYNEYLEIAVESGIIGLLLFLSCILIALLLVFKAAKERKDPFHLGALVAFVSILISGLSSYPLYSLPTFCLFILFFSTITTIIPTRKVPLPKFDNCVHYGSIKTGLTVIILVVTGLISILLFASALPMIHFKDWLLAKTTSLAEDNETAEKYYARSYQSFRDDPSFLLDYGLCLKQNTKYESSLAILKEAKFLSSDPRLYILSGLALQELGKTDSAIKEYKSAHFIVPNQMYPSYLLANIYAKQKDTLSALYYANKVIHSKHKAESIVSDRLNYEMCNLINGYR
jgi:O-antigen polymerase